MPKKNTIFVNCSYVPKSGMKTLELAGFINIHGLPHSWAYMSKYLMKELITQKETKWLIILEMGREDGTPPRIDLIERFVRYINRADKEETIKKIKEQLKLK
jgi:hypothetical protein